MNSELALWNEKKSISDFPIFQSVSDVLDAQKKLFQSKAEEILEDSIEGQRLRFLENEIHKTNLKLMEGRLGNLIRPQQWSLQKGPWSH